MISNELHNNKPLQNKLTMMIGPTQKIGLSANNDNNMDGSMSELWKYVKYLMKHELV